MVKSILQEQELTSDHKWLWYLLCVVSLSQASSSLCSRGAVVKGVEYISSQYLSARARGHHDVALIWENFERKQNTKR